MEIRPETTGKRNATGTRWACIVATALPLCAALALLTVVASTRLVPGLYLAVGMAAALVLCAVVFLLTWSTSRRIRFSLGTVLAALFVFGCAAAGFYVWRTAHAVRSVADAAVEHSAVTFYALQDNSAETLEDLVDAVFGILAELDRENTDAALAQVESEQGLTLSTVEYTGLMELADALRGGEVEGIVLNEGYLSIYEETEGYESFPSEIKALSIQRVEHVIQAQEQEKTETATDTDDKVINILISGSDTRSETIDQRGRSDANIIASVNTETHQILLLSTPRDYYVPLAVSTADAYDKLTHAGIYGMDVLMETLENLYGIAIDYYFRVNFTGFVDIIDALGGIEVYSDYEFTSTHGGYHFDQGYNFLNGEEALSFARERYAFSEGDRQRGRNQIAILRGVLQKATSPSILTSYLTILDSVQDCIDTSLPYDVLAGLVRRQLEDGASWEIESYSVDGTGARTSTYSMNQSLYVMIPDEDTVAEAKEKLAAIGNEVD